MLSCLLMGFVLGRDPADSWPGWVPCIRKCPTGQGLWDAMIVVCNYVFQKICVFFSPLRFRYQRHFHLQNTITVTVIKQRWHCLILPLLLKYKVAVQDSGVTDVMPARQLTCEAFRDGLKNDMTESKNKNKQKRAKVQEWKWRLLCDWRLPGSMSGDLVPLFPGILTAELRNIMYFWRGGQVELNNLLKFTQPTSGEAWFKPTPIPITRFLRRALGWP